MQFSPFCTSQHWRCVNINKMDKTQAPACGADTESVFICRSSLSVLSVSLADCVVPSGNGMKALFRFTILLFLNFS